MAKTNLVVTQSNDLVTAQYKMPLLAKKLFAMAVAKLNPLGTQLKSKFSLSDFKSLLSSEDPNFYARLGQAAIDVSNVSIKFHEDGKDVLCWAFSSFVVDRKTKEIEITFPLVLKKHLLDLKEKYTSYLLQNIITLNNPLHIRLFEILKSKAYLKECVISLDELFESLGLPPGYRNFANLEKYFLEPAKREILNNTFLNYDYEAIKSGKKVIKLRFFNLQYSEEISTKPVEQGEKPEILKKVVAEKKENSQVKEIYDYYMEVFKRDPMYKLTKQREAVISARLAEGFSVEHCKGQIDWVKASPFHNGTDPKNSGRIFNDLADIVFNKTKFDKRIEEVNKKLGKKNTNNSIKLTPEEYLAKKRLEEKKAYEEKYKDILI